MGKGKKKEKRKWQKKEKVPVIDLSSSTPACKQRAFCKKIGQAAQEQMCDIDGLPCYFPSRRRTTRKYLNLKHHKKLNTHVFQLHMEKLWKEVPEDKKNFFTYLDCLWFHLHKEGPDKTKVPTWIVEKDIFLWEYVFVPIICWGHWSLLILCHIGEDLKSGEPCILLLDSLQTTNAKQLEPCIRKFLSDIYKIVGGLENMGLVPDIPFIVPKVLQQRNNEECGNFVLYFMHLFIQDAVENFKVSEAETYFRKDIWHDYEAQQQFSRKTFPTDNLL